MKRYTYILAFIVMVVFTACSSEKKEINDENKKVEVVKKKSDKITLATVDGEKIDVVKTQGGFRFSNAQDRVVLVSFFATWCPPCKAEIPHLNNLQEKYKDSLKIIGVLIESNKEPNELSSFIDDFAINYTIVNSPANQDFADMIGGVKNIPFMVLFDKNGDYVTHYVGAIPEEMIDSDIQEAIKR